MPPKPIIPPAEIPREVLVDHEGMYRILPQRFEMEQLTAVTLLDSERRLIVGYKDVRNDEFWARGHMPDYPLLPGVLMCEAAAQLTAYYCQHCGLLNGDFVGFGGMDNVKFRGPVRPGQRLWLVGTTENHNRRGMVFHVQGFVDDTMVFHGDFAGVSMKMKRQLVGNHADGSD